MQDGTSIAFGGIGIAAIVYGAVMAFAIGPELGRRTIEIKEDWPRVCERTIVANAAAESGPRTQLPRLDMCMLMFGHQGANGRAYCDMHGQTWNGALDGITDTLDAQRRQADEWRKDRATKNAPDRCSCAANYTLETNRLSFALYAGTARVITPPAIHNLRGELKAALSSSRCAMKG